MVYEDTGEVVTDGAVQQHGCHRRVDTAGETQDDAVFAQLALELSHGGIYKRGGDVYHEVAQQLRSLYRVEHLGMELHSPDRLLGAGIGSILHIGGRGYHLEVFGDGSDGVAMAHPYL